MPIFDASSIIYAWDNYPKHQFPPLWRWMAKQIEQEEIVMSEVAFGETKDKAPACKDWLEDQTLKQLYMNTDIVQDAVRIKNLLGIVNDQYKPKGVSENDIFIIATACIHRMELVSNESRQNNLPSVLANYKIPAVCAMQDVSVPWLNFIEFIKKSGQVFE